MNAHQLLKPNGDDSGLFACEKCGGLYGETKYLDAKTCRAKAERCCTAIPCSKCKRPSGSIWNDYILGSTCEACVQAEKDAKHDRWWAKVEKIKAADHDGWVSCEQVRYNNGYFACVGDLIEYLWDHLEFDPDQLDDDSDESRLLALAWPAYALDCTSRSFRLSLGNAIESELEDFYEDASVKNLRGVAELEAAVDAFNEANKDVLCYASGSRVVLLPSFAETRAEYAVIAANAEKAAQARLAEGEWPPDA